MCGWWWCVRGGVWEAKAYTSGVAAIFFCMVSLKEARSAAVDAAYAPVVPTTAARQFECCPSCVSRSNRM